MDWVMPSLAWVCNWRRIWEAYSGTKKPMARTNLNVDLGVLCGPKGCKHICACIRDLTQTDVDAVTELEETVRLRRSNRRTIYSYIDAKINAWI
ncbi:hypothetical protein IC575_024807 [Cucumis melo]